MTRVLLWLADAAQVINGKFYILGGGWSVCETPTPPGALILHVQLDWVTKPQYKKVCLTLFDEDGQPVPGLHFDGAIAGTGLPQLLPGTPLDFGAVFYFPSLLLGPGKRYVWQCFLDGETADEWSVGFTTRAIVPSPHGGGAVE